MFFFKESFEIILLRILCFYSINFIWRFWRKRRKMGQSRRGLIGKFGRNSFWGVREEGCKDNIGIPSVSFQVAV